MNTPSEREVSQVEPALEVGRDASSVAPGSDTRERHEARAVDPLAAEASPPELEDSSDQDFIDMEDPSEQVADQELVTDSDDEDDFGESVDEPTIVAALPTSIASHDDEPAPAEEEDVVVAESELSASEPEASQVVASAVVERDVVETQSEASLAGADSVAAEAEVEPESVSDVVPESEPAPERLTQPDSIVAKRRDEPLPSFDIPDLESAPLGGARLGAAADGAGQQSWAAYGAREVEMPPLNELTEDEDDAVTSIEVQASDVGDLTPPPRAFEPAGFTPAPVPVAPVAAATTTAAAVAAAAMPRLDHRKAATVLIRRVEAPERPAGAASPSAPAMPPWWTGAVNWFRRRRLPRFHEAPGEGVSLRKVGRFFDAIVPELSLVLFGSGIGAASVLFVTRGQDEPEPVQAQAVQPLRAEPGKSSGKPASELTLTERARLGDREALANISRLAANERSSQLTLAQEEGEGVRSAQDWEAFVAGLKGDKSAKQGLSKRFLAFATNPTTMLDAFSTLTEWPGTQGPDLIYSVWEGAPGGHRASTLARSLLYTADQRAKASPALEAALELRESQSCEDFARALPQVLAQGDNRSLDMLVALKHANACGADNQQDCYACLRNDSLLDDAISAVKPRPGPAL